jgi:C1A family cysteine protease
LKDGKLPRQVDWREYCGAVHDQQNLATSAAHAASALVQYFERRASGHVLRPSRLFVHWVARRLGRDHGHNVSIRNVLKAIARFGFPPEVYWPYDERRLETQPEPFAYGFSKEFRALQYVRLDRRDLSRRQTLRTVKTFLAAGFPSIFGFAVCSSISRQACIPFPTFLDASWGGHVVVAVGYDDKLRIRSEKGALLIQNSQGVHWGDDGFGWLPYRYLTDNLAADFWTLWKPAWLKSGEFFRPL